MSLDELREKIDGVDSEILKLIARRQELASKIGEEKAAKNLPVTDADREKAVLEKVRRLAGELNLSGEGIENLYRELIKLAKSVEGTVAAFQGEVGAYSEEATILFFGPAMKTRAYESFDDVFKAVEKGEVAYGVVPVENSLEGSVSRNYDLLLDSNLMVSGEVSIRVSHCLIANPGVKIENIKRVYSHPQALGQSRAYIQRLGFEAIATYNTAGSVKMIKEKKIMDGAAIASARAAKIYGLNILASEIEDNPENYTRFLVLSKNDASPTGNDKTSIVFSVKHRPGSLYDSLYEFARRNLNLTKIESRPTRKKAWEYNFYLDFEGHREDAGAKEALRALEDRALFIKVLGSYPKAK